MKLKLVSSKLLHLDTSKCPTENSAIQSKLAELKSQIFRVALLFEESFTRTLARLQTSSLSFLKLDRL